MTNNKRNKRDIKIRELYAQGEAVTDLARKYNVSETQIRRITRYRRDVQKSDNQNYKCPLCGNALLKSHWLKIIGRREYE